MRQTEQRTFFEGYLDITLGPCPGTPPPDFLAFGTIRFASHKKWVGRRLPLFVSTDGKRLIAGTEELTGTGAGPKYLFSGLLKCGVCGANYVVSDARRYGCAAHKDRGDAVCTNDVKVPRKVVEDKLLEGIKRQLFTPAAMDAFIDETTRLLKEGDDDKKAAKQAAERRLAEAERTIGNIMNAIKAGILTPTTKAELQKAEAEKATLEKRLKAGLPNVATFLPRAMDRYREMVADLANSTQREVAQARTHIRAMLGDSIRLYPTDGGFLEAEVIGDYAGLLDFQGKINVVAGAGFEPTTFGL